MSTFDRSSVNSFAKLDKNYELLVQRMSNFDEQVNEGSVPKKTLNVFVKELASYVNMLDTEISKNEAAIKKHSSS